MQRNLIERQCFTEVDFVLQCGTDLVPVEVKSSDNSKLKSLHLYMEQSAGNIAVRFWSQALSRDTITLPSGKKYSLLNVPFYYCECLEEVLKTIRLSLSTKIMQS